jgi:hypothetical protein
MLAAGFYRALESPPCQLSKQDRITCRIAKLIVAPEDEAVEALSATKMWEKNVCNERSEVSKRAVLWHRRVIQITILSLRCIKELHRKLGGRDRGRVPRP